MDLSNAFVQLGIAATSRSQSRQPSNKRLRNSKRRRLHRCVPPPVEYPLPSAAVRFCPAAIHIQLVQTFRTESSEEFLRQSNAATRACKRSSTSLSLLIVKQSPLSPDLPLPQISTHPLCQIDLRTSRSSAHSSCGPSRPSCAPSPSRRQPRHAEQPLSNLTPSVPPPRARCSKARRRRSVPQARRALLR